jgi:hypothetical protein
VLAKNQGDKLLHPILKRNNKREHSYKAKLLQEKKNKIPQKPTNHKQKKKNMKRILIINKKRIRMNPKIGCEVYY